MRDLKNIFKLTIRRSGIWILLFSILVAANFTIRQRVSLINSAREMRDVISFMQDDVGEVFDENAPIDRDYMANAKKVADKYAKKYNLDSLYDPYALDEKTVDSVAKKSGMTPDEIFDAMAPLGQYQSISYNLESWQDPYINEDHKEESYSLGLADFMSSISEPIVYFLLLIGILITSLEQSLSYYDFSMMYPWKKRDEVWMKAIALFAIGLGLFLVNFILGAAMLKGSSISALVSFTGMGSLLVKILIKFLGISFLAVATGMLAGNFLGHIGLMIISFGGLDLISSIIGIIVSIFSDTAARDLSDSYDRYWQKASDFGLAFKGIFNLTDSWKSYGGFILLVLLWTILAYLVSAKASSEKSGMMIISKPVEIIAKIIAVLALTCILFIIVGDAFIGSSSLFVNLMVFALVLLISKKVFDILFKVRLKF